MRCYILVGEDIVYDDALVTVRLVTELVADQEEGPYVVRQVFRMDIPPEHCWEFGELLLWVGEEGQAEHIATFDSVEEARQLGLPLHDKAVEHHMTDRTQLDVIFRAIPWLRRGGEA